jgi:arginine decarboxylase
MNILLYQFSDTTRQLLGDSYKSNSDYIDFSEHSRSAEENDQHNGVRKNHFEIICGQYF